MKKRIRESFRLVFRRRRYTPSHETTTDERHAGLRQCAISCSKNDVATVKLLIS